MINLEECPCFTTVVKCMGRCVAFTCIICKYIMINVLVVQQRFNSLAGVIHLHTDENHQNIDTQNDKVKQK